MRRLLPYPLLSLSLLVIWMVLKQSMAPGTILLGAALGVGLAQVFGVLRPPKARMRHYPRALLLLLRVMGDIVRSNIAVARIVLGRRDSAVHSGFVAVPLTLTDHYGLAVLACIITSTPGTIWVSHDSTRNVLLIHVLDLVDADSWVDTIKQRYERPLLEIFQ